MQILRFNVSMKYVIPVHMFNSLYQLEDIIFHFHWIQIHVSSFKIFINLIFHLYFFNYYEKLFWTS